jgi:hypothetical protein
MPVRWFKAAAALHCAAVTHLQSSSHVFIAAAAAAAAAVLLRMYK